MPAIVPRRRPDVKGKTKERPMDTIYARRLFVATLALILALIILFAALQGAI